MKKIWLWIFWWIILIGLLVLLYIKLTTVDTCMKDCLPDDWEAGSCSEKVKSEGEKSENITEDPVLTEEEIIEENRNKIPILNVNIKSFIESFTWEVFNWTNWEPVLIKKDYSLYYNDNVWIAVVLWREWKWRSIIFDENSNPYPSIRFIGSYPFEVSDWIKLDLYDINIIENDTYPQLDSWDFFWDKIFLKRSTLWSNNKYHFVETATNAWHQTIYEAFPTLDCEERIENWYNYWMACDWYRIINWNHIRTWKNWIEQLFSNWLIFYDVKESESAINTKEENKNSQIPTFEELEDVVAMCPYETMWWWYDEYPVYKREFILPYWEWYIGYNYWWNNWEWWGYYLTYKSLDNPCEVISSSDEFFFRYFNDRTHYINPQEPIRADNKVFRWLGGIALDIVEKELNCEMWKDITDDGTCQKEMNKYMYNLVIWKEKNDTFTKWMNYLKKSIDTNNYTTPYTWNDIEVSCYENNTWLDFLNEYWEDNKKLTEEKRKEYRNIRNKRIRECIDSFIK